MNSKKNLILLRRKIDRIDFQILKLLRQRFKFTQKIQFYKQKTALPILQKKREKEISERLKGKAGRLGLPKGFVARIYKTIFGYSRKPF